VHCGHPPQGEHWDSIAPHVTVDRIEPGPAAPLDVLSKYGGIYADLGTLFVERVPARYRRAQFVIGQGADGLSTMVMMSKPNAPFVDAWRAKTRGSLSGRTGARLAAKMPNDVRVEPQIDGVIAFPDS
jgi:hypothetical protein